MEILLMGFSKIKLMPYLNFYLGNIDAQRHRVHVLYWNRDLKEENVAHLKNVTLHEFRCYQEDNVPPLTKIGSFLKYRRYAKALLNSRQFDMVVPLHSMPAVLMQGILRKRYRGRYIFDYRDVTYEGIPPFRELIHSVVRDSAATFVSSDGFRKYLPADASHKIYTSHNLLTDSLDHRDEKRLNGIPSAKIRMAFWGYIRDTGVNKQIISRLAGDDRFELHYYGRDNQISRDLADFAQENGGENVFFHGEYKPEDRYRFVRQTDVIHNLYTAKTSVDAMTNKYYDSIIFRIPQICMTDTFMGSAAQSSGTGIMLDPYQKDFADQLYRYITSLDRTAFDANCDAELDRILTQYNAGATLIRQLLGQSDTPACD
jgi:hypothetical protein